MRFPLGILLLASLCASCVPTPASKVAEFVAAPSPIDDKVDGAPIEVHIIDLPPYAFHEESVEEFQTRALTAREREPRNRGKDRDYLYLGGDGSWPAKGFRLDRKARTLHIQVYSSEPDCAPYETTMRRVAGGWVPGSTRSTSRDS